jgi:hypothetical protein
MSKEPENKESLDQAIAKDFAACIERDLNLMSPGQLALTKRVLSDFESKRTDHSQRDFERKVTKMSDRQLEEYVRDADYDRQQNNG